MDLLSAAQSRELDRQAIHDRNIAGARLMARAGAAVVAVLEREYPAALTGRVGVLCGGGNNGGDGLVVARLLRERQVPVTVLLFAPPEKLRGDAADALSKYRSRTGEEPGTVTELAQWHAAREQLLGCDLLVDALFGTGLVRPVRSWIGDVIRDVNRDYHGPVLAVDVPSGMGADGSGPAEAGDAPLLRAQRTVTFGTPKLGHYLSAHAAGVGALEVADIGHPADLLPKLHAHATLATPEICRRYLKPRAPAAHKGAYGHVLVVAGSLGKSGAAALASTAALRLGAGLVTAAVPSGVLPLVAGARPEIMTAPLPATAAGCLWGELLESDALRRLLAPATVVAMGPGLTTEPEAIEAVRRVLAALQVPCVLDADGLNAFAGRRDDLRLPAGGVLTPHPGEIGRLFGVSGVEIQSRRIYYAQRLAAETGAVTVLKGHTTLVADPGGHVIVNPTGNPGMATAGAGDVLTGMIAALLAQFPRARRLETAAAAVYLHGRAGDDAAARLGPLSLLAGDITAALPDAIRATAADMGS